jgi:uncharacterized protein YrrD
MITTGKSIIGLQVILISNGHPVRMVTNIVYDPERSRVKALILGKTNSSDKTILPVENLRSIGEDAVMIDSKQVLQAAIASGESSQYVRNYLAQEYSVVTEKGDQLGVISDIFFDTSTAEIKEFEVSLLPFRKENQKKQRFGKDEILAVRGTAAIVKE